MCCTNSTHDDVLQVEAPTSPQREKMDDSIHIQRMQPESLGQFRRGIVAGGTWMLRIRIVTKIAASSAKCVAGAT